MFFYVPHKEEVPVTKIIISKFLGKTGIFLPFSQRNRPKKFNGRLQIWNYCPWCLHRLNTHAHIWNFRLLVLLDRVKNFFMISSIIQPNNSLTSQLVRDLLQSFRNMHEIFLKKWNSWKKFFFWKIFPWKICTAFEGILYPSQCMFFGFKSSVILGLRLFCAALLITLTILFNGLLKNANFRGGWWWSALHRNPGIVLWFAAKQCQNYSVQCSIVFFIDPNLLLNGFSCIYLSVLSNKSLLIIPFSRCIQRASMRIHCSCPKKAIFT